jgi:hypothetical protein
MLWKSRSLNVLTPALKIQKMNAPFRIEEIWLDIPFGTLGTARSFSGF